MSFRRVLTPVVLLSYAVLALGSGPSNRKPPPADRDQPPTAPASPVVVPSVASGFCPAAKGVPNACGWAADGSACTACVTSKCCEEGRACARDCTCALCTESADPAKCAGASASFAPAVACMRASCAAECGMKPANAAGAAPGPQTQGGRCRATRCTQGPAGDAFCRKQGCGVCFFGGCNGF